MFVRHPPYPSTSDVPTRPRINSGDKRPASPNIVFIPKNHAPGVDTNRGTGGALQIEWQAH